MCNPYDVILPDGVQSFVAQIEEGDSTSMMECYYQYEDGANWLSHSPPKISQSSSSGSL